MTPVRRHALPPQRLPPIGRHPLRAVLKPVPRACLPQLLLFLGLPSAVARPLETRLERTPPRPRSSDLQPPRNSGTCSWPVSVSKTVVIALSLSGLGKFSAASASGRWGSSISVVAISKQQQQEHQVGHRLMPRRTHPTSILVFNCHSALFFERSDSDVHERDSRVGLHLENPASRCARRGSCS